jgi:hypothetical protein
MRTWLPSFVFCCTLAFLCFAINGLLGGPFASLTLTRIPGYDGSLMGSINTLRNYTTYYHLPTGELQHWHRPCHLQCRPDGKLVLSSFQAAYPNISTGRRALYLDFRLERTSSAQIRRLLWCLHWHNCHSNSGDACNPHWRTFLVVVPLHSCNSCCPSLSHRVSFSAVSKNCSGNL